MQRATAEAWVDVPASASLALGGLRPNPASGANLRVAFTLPSEDRARIELIDVSGRRVAAQDVGGAGAHLERLQSDAHVQPGLYWLRLTQGTRTVTVRAVVAS